MKSNYFWQSIIISVRLSVTVAGLFVIHLTIPQNSFSEGQSLTIYPPIIEVQVEPPSSPTVPIVIQNNIEEDVSLKIELIPFIQKGTNGEVVLTPKSSEVGFYPYYRERIQFLLDGKKISTLDLSALESREIVLNINLSEGDPPGDYYYSIVFISDGKNTIGTSATKIPAGIATNLLLSIGPKDKATGGISEFKTKSFTTKGPIDFSLIIHNGSKHLIQPTGNVQITNILGKKVGNIDILPQYVLSLSDRHMIDVNSPNEDRFTNEKDTHDPQVRWREKFVFGWYKATATISLSSDSRPIQSVSYFLAFPLYFFIFVVILLFIAISIYLRVKKKI